MDQLASKHMEQMSIFYKNSHKFKHSSDYM